MSDHEYRQYAPYPDILQELVDHCRMGMAGDWEVTLEDIERDDDHGRGAAGGLTLKILTKGYDTYHPDRGQHYRVYHYFPVPAATYDTRSWRRWLFEQYSKVWLHEAMESFAFVYEAPGGYINKKGEQVDRLVERPYAPSHGPGNDPYLVREVGTTLDQTTRFTGEVV